VYRRNFVAELEFCQYFICPEFASVSAENDMDSNSIQCNRFASVMQ